MDPAARQHMLALLYPLAEKLRPQGPPGWKWTILKSQLRQFSDRYLEDHHTEILELFTACMFENGQSQSLSAPTMLQSTSPRAGFASVAPPPSSYSLSHSIDTQSSSKPPPSNTSSKSTVDEGFIRITQTTYDGARFSYSNKEDNFVGLHILKRNELLPQIKNNKIWLTFFLETKPKKSFKLEFKTKKKASFDVSLGTKWKDEGEEDADESTIEGVAVRPANDFRTSSPSQTTTSCIIAGAGAPPPEYVSLVIKDVLRTWWEPKVGPHQVSQAPIMSPPSRPPPFQPNDASTGGRSESKSTMKIPPRETSVEGPAPTGPPKAGRTESDASNSEASIFSKYEDEGDEYSESSVPDILEDDRVSYDRITLAALEEECYNNPWQNSSG